MLFICDEKQNACGQFPKWDFKQNDSGELDSVATTHGFPPPYPPANIGVVVLWRCSFSFLSTPLQGFLRNHVCRATIHYQHHTTHTNNHISNEHSNYFDGFVSLNYTNVLKPHAFCHLPKLAFRACPNLISRNNHLVRVVRAQSFPRSPLYPS